MGVDNNVENPMADGDNFMAKYFAPKVFTLSTPYHTHHKILSLFLKSKKKE